MNKRSISKSKCGFTLVEAIVGAALFAICSLILMSGFMTATAVIKKSADIAKKAAAASTVLEGGSDDMISVQTAAAEMSFTIDGVTYQIPGYITSSYDIETSVGFVEFGASS